MIDLIAIENHLPALQVVVPLLLAPVAILVSLPFLSWLVALFGSLFCLYSSVSLFFHVSEFGKINYCFLIFMIHFLAAFRTQVN